MPAHLWIEGPPGTADRWTRAAYRSGGPTSVPGRRIPIGSRSEQREDSPPGVRRRQAVALLLVAVGAARRAQASAVGPAQRRQRQLEHDRLADQGAQIQPVIDDGV